MTTKPDWQAVPQEGAKDQTKKPEDALTAEEMLDPEMVQAMAVPFPEDDAQPGDPGYLSEEELTKRWMELQKRIQVAPVVRFPRPSTPVWTAVAAAIALIFAGLFGMTQWRLQKYTSEPQAIDSRVLESDHTRGPESDTPVECKGSSIALIAPLPMGGFERYQVVLSEITNNDPRKWSGWVSNAADDTLTVVVPCGYLQPGRYDMVVYGLTGKSLDRVDGYKLRVKR